MPATAHLFRMVILAAAGWLLTQARPAAVCWRPWPRRAPGAAPSGPFADGSPGGCQPQRDHGSRRLSMAVNGVPGPQDRQTTCVSGWARRRWVN